MSLLDRPWLFWRLQVAGWLGFWAVYTAATAEVLPFRLALADKSVFAVTGFLASLLLWPVCRTVRGWSWPAAIAVVVAASYIGGLLWSAAYGYINQATGITVGASWWPRLGGALGMSGTLLAWCALYFGAVYARELEQRQAELARERERALLARSQARDAQLRALRYQLDPHFLFNALNAVSTLVGDGQTDAAQMTINRLAEFLRATLDDRDTADIGLARELELVDRYLAIERVRLQDRLRVHIEASEQALEARVPALMLQPLVENAVRHGIALRRDGGCIDLRARRDGDRLRITVRDGAIEAGAAVATPPGPPPLGLGLANTRARLAVLFADDFSLTLDTRPDGAEVRIDLPFRVRPAVETAP